VVLLLLTPLVLLLLLLPLPLLLLLPVSVASSRPGARNVQRAHMPDTRAATVEAADAPAAAPPGDTSTASSEYERYICRKHAVTRKAASRVLGKL
jgi:hypothetical protein